MKSPLTNGIWIFFAGWSSTSFGTALMIAGSLARTDCASARIRALRQHSDVAHQRLGIDRRSARADHAVKHRVR